MVLVHVLPSGVCSGGGGVPGGLRAVSAAVARLAAERGAQMPFSLCAGQESFLSWVH